MGRALLFLAVGLFCVWMGLRSFSGYEATTEHLFSGRFEEIVCEDGRPAAGKGLHTPSADIACDEESDRQRRQAPWWLAGGLIVTAIGMTQFRKARSG